MARYSENLRTVVRVIKKKREQLVLAVGVNLILIIVAASIMYFVEHPAQPDAFVSIPHSLYWTLVTLTTIGYGDIVPITTAGRFLAVIVAFFGVGMVALPASILAGGFAAEGLGGNDAQHEPVECPDCGSTFNPHDEA